MVCAVGTEDFSATTEVGDAGNWIAVTTNCLIDITAMEKIGSAYRYWDKGVGHFVNTADFTHDFECEYTADVVTNSGFCAVWTISDALENIGVLPDYLSLQMVGNTGVPGFRLSERVASGTPSNTTYNITQATPYWNKITFDSTVGTYGTLKCDIYTSLANRDSETSSVANLSLTLTAAFSFRYLYPAQARDSGGTTSLTGWVSNYYLNEPVNGSGSLIFPSMVVTATGTNEVSEVNGSGSLVFPTMVVTATGINGIGLFRRRIAMRNQ